MQIFVRGLDGETVVLNAPEDVTVAQIREEIGADETLILSSESRILSNEQRLSALCTIEVNARLLGGKVHGSLARAGKVRAQTPKVEKQDKKKKPVGRAKRRLQYIRRFVNVASAGPGRKRGPNAQSA